MSDIDVLVAELTGDSLGRGYAVMSNQAATDDLNTFYRPALRGPGSLREYLLLNRNRSNEGTDTTLTPLWGRVQHVAQSAVGADPFGRGDTLTLVQIHSAMTVLELARADSINEIDYTNTEFDAALSQLAAGTGCKAISAADKTAIQALNANLQTRGQELGLGIVRVGHVDAARA